jgi:hypothetical protein
MDESALKALIDALQASRDSLDLWLNLSSALVVIGVMLEIVFVVREYREELQDWRRGIVRPPGRPSRRWLVTELIGVALVSVGVAGEFFIDVKAGALETQIRKANEDLVLLLEQKANDAEASAEGAASAAATAKRSADEAQNRVGSVARQADDLLGKYADAEKSLYKLRFLVVPRDQLLMRNGCSFVNAVEPFAGQKIEIRTNSAGISDPNDVEEMKNLVGSIEFLLGQVSKWSTSEAQGENGWGVTVTVRQNSSLETRNAANVLASAFGDCGLTDMQGNKPISEMADAGSAVDRENGPPDTIVLFAGRHPR